MPNPYINGINITDRDQSTLYDIWDARIDNGYDSNSRIIGTDPYNGVTPTAGVLVFAWSKVESSGLDYTFTITNGQDPVHPTGSIPAGTLVSIKADYSWSFAGTLISDITPASTTVSVRLFRQPPSNWTPAEQLNNLEEGYLWFPEHPEVGAVPKGAGAVALGRGNRANEEASSAFGRNCIADGRYSVVGGRENWASYAGMVGGAFNRGYGLYSDIQGYHNTVYGSSGHAEGSSNIAGLPGTTSGGQHAEGGAGIASLSNPNRWKSSTSYSKNDTVTYDGLVYVACTTIPAGSVDPKTDWEAHRGDPDTAIWRLVNAADSTNAHKEGTACVLGSNSHAGGRFTLVLASNASAHGYFNYISPDSESASVEGKNNKLFGSSIASFSAGQQNVIRNAANSAVFGNGNKLSGSDELVGGSSNTVSGQRSFVVGSQNTSTANNSVTLGYRNTASGGSAITSGYLSVNTGDYSIVNGQYIHSAGKFAVAVGGSTTTTAWNANSAYGLGVAVVYEGVRYASTHEGNQGNTPPTDLNSTDYTTYQHWIPILENAGNNSISVGLTSARKATSAVFGQANLSTVEQSFVAGFNNVVTAQGAAAIGQGLVTVGETTRQLVVGRYNYPTKAPFIVGGGTGYDTTRRKNILSLDANGNLHIAGAVYANDTTQGGTGGSAIVPYTLPSATASALGGIKLGSNTVQSVAARPVSSTADRTYAVQVNSAGQAVVNVPWTSSSGSVLPSAWTVSGPDRVASSGDHDSSSIRLGNDLTTPGTQISSSVCDSSASQPTDPYQYSDSIDVDKGVWISSTVLSLDYGTETVYYNRERIAAVGDPLSFGVCSTSAGTANKTVSIPGVSRLSIGTTIRVKFVEHNSVSNPTLNVNNSGAIYIKSKGTSAPGTGSVSSWEDNQVITLVYDGTYWMVADFQSGYKVLQTDSSGNADYRVLLANSANDTTETSSVRKSGNLRFNPSTGKLTVNGEISSSALTVNGHKVTVSSTAPSSPAVGDVWIDIS